MAKKTDVEQLKVRFAQQARARIPFNPVDGVAITGANVRRLQDGMETFGWVDYRFVSAEQASANGWSISSNAESVVMSTRDPSNGDVTMTKLFNAASVRGMPSLEAMLAMSDEAMLQMRGEAAVVEILGKDPQRSYAPVEVETADVEEEIFISPAPQLQLEEVVQTGGKQVVQGLSVDEPDARHAAAPEVEAAYAVMAPYWREGLHNHEGIALAEQVNRLIDLQKLGKNKAAIATMLNTYPDNRRLGLEIVPRSKYLNDPYRKVNPAEPVQLLEGELIRDKAGAYRPKVGGRAVLQDKGTSLVLKSKSEHAYRGAMELALAKGWKAIELKGTPKILAQAWLEAKVLGLEVVNYAPTERDRENLAQRMAEEVQKREAAAAKADALAPELVEVRPVIDANGKQVTATVTSHVERSNRSPQLLFTHMGAPGDALPDTHAQEPVLTRSVTRLGDVVREEVNAGGSMPRTPKKVAATVVDREVSEALTEAKLEQTEVDLEKGVTLVAHGPAPYNHIPKNKESYFVTVKDDEGHTRTVWGKDLPRSLAEVGAIPGDKITLVDADRKPVEVEVKELDGTTSWKPASFVTWTTTVLSRVTGVAQKLPVNVVTEGMHVGPVMKMEGGMIAQKSGRDPNSLVWHDVANLKGSVPAVGEMAEINYANGQGNVKEPLREQELGR